jgi:hypothetical protein
LDTCAPKVKRLLSFYCSTKKLRMVKLTGNNAQNHDQY